MQSYHTYTPPSVNHTYAKEVVSALKPVRACDLHLRNIVGTSSSNACNYTLTFPHNDLFLGDCFSISAGRFRYPLSVNATGRICKENQLSEMPIAEE